MWNSVDADRFTHLVDEVDAFNAALRDSGELVDSHGLVPAAAVRMVGDAPVVTDGPYLEPGVCRVPTSCRTSTAKLVPWRSHGVSRTP